jgi:4a-hydroxytetrahydrobiopterin dehydratase
MALLTKEQIEQQLHLLEGWGLQGKAITRRFELTDFVRAMGFVQSVALLAEKQDHHPDIDIRWNTVILTLSTHSEGGLTSKDIKLATEINKLPH